MIWFWVWPVVTAFLQKMLGQKMVISRGFSNIFQNYSIPIEVTTWIPKHISLKTREKNQGACGLGAKLVKWGPTLLKK